MKSLTVEVYGVPKGQPRPRAFKRGNKAGVYDPGTADTWKGDIVRELRIHIAGMERTQTPVKIEMAFRMPRPRSHYRSGKYSQELKGTAPSEHACKPDIDNMIKAVMDAVTCAGLWLDDAQVCELRAVKLYTEKRPGMMLRLVW